eukprot:scaffold92626_cov33-Phaeocystis_antarctica.AAC.1
MRARGDGAQPTTTIDCDCNQVQHCNSFEREQCAPRALWGGRERKVSGRMAWLPRDVVVEARGSRSMR